MASVRYGAFITEMRGSVGGSTFKGSKYGPVCQTKEEAIASSAKLTKADAGRLFQPTKIIAEVSGLWRLLTDAQRAAWNAAAPNWPALNRFGDTYTPSGFQVFMKLNAQLANLTGVTLGDPPLPVSIGVLAATTFDIPDDVNMNIDYTGGVPAGFQLRVEATQSMNASVEAKNSFFKIVAQIPNGVVFPQNLADGYVPIYGAWISGATIWFRICLISITTGQKGLYQYYKITAA